jgi:hypothetical protein
MVGARSAGRSRWSAGTAVVIALSTCGLLAIPATAAAGRTHPRVASLKVKLPAPGDVTLARVVLRVKIAPGPRSHRRHVLKFRLRNRSRLAHSLIVLVGGKRVNSSTAAVARLVAQTSTSATFVAAVAIFSPKPGAGPPRAHQAAARTAQDAAASFEASTEDEETVIVTVEIHENLLVATAQGHFVRCAKGSRVQLHFSRAELVEVSGPTGISDEAAEEIFEQAVLVCVEESEAVDELLSRWLNPGSMPAPAPPPPPTLFSGSFAGTTDAEGDPSRINITGEFNRAISGIAVWAPPGTQFTNCDPTPTCQLRSHGGGSQNSVYFNVNVPANQPFPLGLKIELNHIGNYTDTYQGQVRAADGSTSSSLPFHLSG